MSKRKFIHNDGACEFYKSEYWGLKQKNYQLQAELNTIDSLKDLNSILTEERDNLLFTLNTLGHKMIAKKDVYNFVMGDLSALDKYKGDPE